MKENLFSWAQRQSYSESMERGCTCVPNRVFFLSYPVYIKMEIEPCSEK
jgi:hypothetical protein